MNDLLERAQRVARIAAAAAEAVDREGRFPAEAVAAMRVERLLGCAAEAPATRAGIRDLVGVSERLGRACASSAMIFAMHQINVANLVTHGASDWHRAFLARIADEQLLVASSTSEKGAGTGDIRHSSCALDPQADGLALAKEAGTISGGLQCPARFSLLLLPVTSQN